MKYITFILSLSSPALIVSLIYLFLLGSDHATLINDIRTGTVHVDGQRYECIPYNTAPVSSATDEMLKGIAP